MVELALTLKIDQEELEEWTNLLSSNVKINYPVNIAAKPRVLLSKDFPDELPPIRGSGQVLDDYRITADMVPARIRVYDSKEESMPLYIIGVPKPGRATDLMVKALADKLTDRITIDVEEITDPKKMLKLKDRFYAESKQLIDEEIPASEKDKEVLAGMLLHNTYGLGDVEILMNDDWLEELGINTANVPITAYHKKYGWTKTSILLGDEKVVYNYATQIGRKIGRNITALDPIMDAHLLTGDRVCATLFPISSLGNTITIRKFARSPWTLIHFISPKFYTLSKEIAAFLWLCFQYELNVMVGGGTASGKTSMLSSLCSLIQPTQRVITIEDTREIKIGRAWCRERV